MARIVITGLWMCVITVLSSYAAVSWVPGTSAPKADEYLDGLTYQKLPPIQIPIIADSAVQGYVAITVVFTADSRTLKKMSIAPTPFVLDEAFQQIYNDKELNFKKINKYNITARLSAIKNKVNERVGMEVLKDVMVENLVFVSKDDIRRK
jgi:hypothetical protein